MRSRTELMFQVAMEKGMGSVRAGIEAPETGSTAGANDKAAQQRPVRPQ